MTLPTPRRGRSVSPFLLDSGSSSEEKACHRNSQGVEDNPEVIPIRQRRLKRFTSSSSSDDDFQTPVSQHETTGKNDCATMLNSEDELALQAAAFQPARQGYGEDLVVSLQAAAATTSDQHTDRDVFADKQVCSQNLQENVCATGNSMQESTAELSASGALKRTDFDFNQRRRPLRSRNRKSKRAVLSLDQGCSFSIRPAGLSEALNQNTTLLREKSTKREIPLAMGSFVKVRHGRKHLCDSNPNLKSPLSGSRRR